MARKHLLAITAVAVLALLASACGASGGDKQADDGDKPTTTAAAQEAAAGSFGDLPAPVCGPGKDKVADGEGGTGADKLYIGVATDRSSSIRPGLNKEMWDASEAFTKWCNEAGVIVAFMMYVRLFTQPLSQIAQSMNNLQRTAAASEVTNDELRLYRRRHHSGRWQRGQRHRRRRKGRGCSDRPGVSPPPP